MASPIAIERHIPITMPVARASTAGVPSAEREARREKTDEPAGVTAIDGQPLVSGPAHARHAIRAAP